jgi:hypothetical protein
MLIGKRLIVDIYVKGWNFPSTPAFMPNGLVCLFFEKEERAGVAQLVEQRFCKPQVVGSSPFSSSISLYFGLVRLSSVKSSAWRDTQVAKGIRL